MERFPTMLKAKQCKICVKNWQILRRKKKKVILTKKLNAIEEGKAAGFPE